MFRYEITISDVKETYHRKEVVETNMDVSVPEQRLLATIQFQGNVVKDDELIDDWKKLN